MEKAKYYSVLWYTGYDAEKGQPTGDFEEREFKTYKSAMKFYEVHKNDEGKYFWWVTSRDEDGYVIDDFVW